MVMIRRSLFVAAFFAALFVPALPALADEPPALSGKPDASEAAFVRAMQADLTTRFATEADARRAGFVRYTNEDDTGAISYANRRWTSSDVHHPSQLWYDAHGALLGADYSLPKTGAVRPHAFGLQPGRWAAFDAHVHYVAIDPATGKKLYDKFVMPPQFRAGGGDPMHPTAATLVNLKLVPSANDVETIFLFPSIWDVSIWIKPNPNGAFADKNPLVTPSTH
jgi:hypothetical protein